MSNIREYVGCKSIEAVNYDGKGNDLCNMWLTDEEIVRCRDCRHFKESFMRCKKHFTELYANDGKSIGMVELSVKPDDFCSQGEQA